MISLGSERNKASLGTATSAINPRRSISETPGGEYSSSISRVFNKINEKLKGKIEKREKVMVQMLRMDKWENNPCESNPRGNKVDTICKQFESVINKMEMSKMLGRDLSYCMNILSKIDYFKGHSFWTKACNKLVKGNMIHKINMQSYFIIANSLSKVDTIFFSHRRRKQEEVEQKEMALEEELEQLAASVEGKNWAERTSPVEIRTFEFLPISGEKVADLNLVNKFEAISFGGIVKIERGKCQKKKHKIYDEIAFRFLIDLQKMDLDCISCVLNLFAKLNMNSYNFLGYYFADYILLSKFRVTSAKEWPINQSKECTMNHSMDYFSNDVTDSMSKINNSTQKENLKSVQYEERTNFLELNRYNISKLVIILHSLAKLGVIHIEFFTLCCDSLEKHLNYLNNLDICNILYAFSKIMHLCKGRKKYTSMNMLRRIQNENFQSYVNTVLKYTLLYESHYRNRNELQCVYGPFLCKNHVLTKNVEEKMKKLCENMERDMNKLILKITKFAKKEHVLDKFSALQISSLALSIGKLKLSSYDIFYAFNRKVHYLWKYFSLHSIADFLFGINEKNIFDERVTLLLCYQLMKVIYVMYKNFFYQKKSFILRNHLNMVRQNREYIYIFEKSSKKVQFLSEKDCSLMVRIFQSLAKSQIFVRTDPSILSIQLCENFPYDICSMGLVKASKSAEDESCDTTGCTYETDQFISEPSMNSKTGTPFYSADVGKVDHLHEKKNSWRELNSYPNGRNPSFSTFEKYANLIKVHTLRTFCLTFHQHFDLLCFESKCMICYFSLHIPDLMSPMMRSYKKLGYLYNMFDSEMDEKRIFPNDETFRLTCTGKMNRTNYLRAKVGSNIYKTFSTRLLFHILEVMNPESLSEVTIRQIFISILCIHLNIMEWCPRRVEEAISGEISSGEMSWKNFSTAPNLACEGPHSGSPTRGDISISTNFQAEGNKFLKENACISHKLISPSSAGTHIEVHSSLRNLIEILNGSRENFITQSNEVIVGPFVLDCILECRG
ncbi:hypothetical protein, conserved [Plasmodium gonderi]|uniref:Uncharacterized protein n=1 Tax=Plasmodium gonderi TaxID=77519 RepID=A0A1Y1JCC1_PLAGO|nr:hypothetical protein, conserved [Plasmodium gonderi]GAW79880.1 hypothetical protein, conserved [Plasmodium gonderi]